MDVSLITTDTDAWALGLRGISAVLKAAGHHTRLVFMKTHDELYTKGNLEEVASLARHSDLIGVSCLSRGSIKAKQTIEYLRSQKKPIIWGGVHASLNPEECAKYADIVCRGEGEGMILELLERLALGRDWEDMENVAYKNNGSLRLNDLRPPIRDLDELPLPDFTFEDEYHLTAEGFVQVSAFPELQDDGRIILNSSRGCAFHCTYCCNAKIKALYPVKSRYVRRMSVSKLIEHAIILRKIFPLARSFYLIDEDFGARPYEELVQLSEEFSEKVGLPLECQTHPARISHQTMDLLVKAGLFKMRMGIESGSERTKREIYDRHEPNKVVKRAVEIISDYPQVVPIYFFIIANPYEERKDLIATARFISELPQGCYIIEYNLVFFPGSYLFDRAVKDGLIEGKHDSGYDLDYLCGLDYGGHTWKSKNLYLNGLIFLMEGYCGRYRIGLLPRPFIKILLHPRLIEFNEKHRFAIQAIISIKLLGISVRHRGAWLVRRTVRRIIRDPAVSFKFLSLLKTKVLHSHR